MDQFLSTLTKYKKQVLVLLILIPLLFLGIYLALNPTAFRPKAAGASLKLDPASVNKKPDDPLVVSLILDPAGRSIVAADIEIKYDPTVLQISSNDIISPIFKSNPVKTVDQTTGLIKLGFATTQPVSAASTIATLSFKGKANGNTNIFLGSSSVIDRTGRNVLESPVSQVLVQIAGESIQLPEISGAPSATYSTTPDQVVSGQPFTLTIQTKGSKVENPALFVGGNEVRITESGSNTYVWTNASLPAGRIILQLAGGCKNASSVKPDCSDAQIGFNPYQLNVLDPSAIPQPVVTTSGTSEVTLSDVVNNWGKSGKGDVNNDGRVDSLDFAIVYADTERP